MQKNAKKVQVRGKESLLSFLCRVGTDHPEYTFSHTTAFLAPTQQPAVSHKSEGSDGYHLLRVMQDPIKGSLV
jgi:hypothetical protein